MTLQDPAADAPSGAQRKISLKYLVEHEAFIVCTLLTADQFVRYCADRGVRTSVEQLERLEKLGLFYPLLRVQYPPIKVKVEYAEDRQSYKWLGALQPDEEWHGETIDDRADLFWQKEHAGDWLERGLIWDPVDRPFVPWDSFYDREEGERLVDSYYSPFQVYSLQHRLSVLTSQVSADLLVLRTPEEVAAWTQRMKDWAHLMVSEYQERQYPRDDAFVICQAISNAYFPQTQTDRRTIQVSYDGSFHEWDWFKYRREWDASKVLADLGIGAEDVKHLQEMLAREGQWCDPLDDWYELVSFVSVEQKRRLRGEAQLAQTLYAMEYMLRLFYKDLTGTDLARASESTGWRHERLFGEGIPDNELKYLEYLANLYHVNPRPALILVVEGDGEEEQYARLAAELFGASLPSHSIEVLNLKGIGNFEGEQAIDKFGALEKFIDYYHYRQTVVFVILDREGRVHRVRERLIPKRSIFFPTRRVTKAEYIHVWAESVEFDNFCPDEIARAMTEVTGGLYAFTGAEVEACRARHGRGQADPLSALYREKTQHDLRKRELLAVLFGYIIAAPEMACDGVAPVERPIVDVLRRVFMLGRHNHQPFTQDIWEENQRSGYFGDIIHPPEVPATIEARTGEDI